MIEHTTIDGIPALLAPGSGPTRGGITFRVGHADETLARSGVTHLIEHLTLHRLGVTDYHYNGITGATVTHFVSQGSADDVGNYLNGVSDALADLPWQRIENEKDILRTEAAGRSRSVVEPMLVWRYGARGYGLGGYPEWGLADLTADDVRTWLARYFTKDNAVLWFSGAVPTNLRLSLPEGGRMPLPAITSAVPHTPAYFVGPARAVALHTVVPRSTAAQVYAQVLERELFRALRQEGGYSYTAATSYDPIDREVATIVALADAGQDNQDAVLGGFVDVLAKLRWGRIEQADIDATLTKARESLGDPDADAARLPSVAFGTLLGAPLRQTADALAEIDAIVLDDVKLVCEAAAANALLMVPQGRAANPVGFAPAPTSSVEAVLGEHYPMHERPDHALVIGPDGVSTTEPGSIATVRFAECAAVLAYPDGGRIFIGNDGLPCRVEPTLYAVDAAQLQSLDQSLRPEVLVHLAAREPDAIPSPTPPSSATQPRRPQRMPRPPLSRRDRLTLAVTAVLWGFTIGLGAELVVALARPPDEVNDPLVGMLFVGFIVVAIPATVYVFLAGPILRPQAAVREAARRQLDARRRMSQQ